MAVAGEGGGGEGGGGEGGGGVDGCGGESPTRGGTSRGIGLPAPGSGICLPQARVQTAIIAVCLGGHVPLRAPITHGVMDAGDALCKGAIMSGSVAHYC